MTKQIIELANDAQHATQESTTVSYAGRIPENTFGEALRCIDAGHAQIRRGLVVAFRASLADLMCSKSTKRLEVFWKHVSATAFATKIRKSIYIFSGGFVYKPSAKGTDRIFAQEKSVVEFDPKLGWLLKSNITREEWAVAVAAYSGIASFEYDSITVKTPEAKLTLDPLVKQLRRYRDKRHDLDMIQRQNFVKLWDLACELFPELSGLGLTSDGPGVVDGAVAQDGKSEATMPAKPTRKRNNKTA